MPIAPEYLHLVHAGPFGCYLYGRNSRDPKRRGRSVTDQLHDGRGLADAHGWPVLREFTDTNRSASRHARQARGEFEEMLAGVARGEPRIVVAFEASRYYRDLEAYLRLRNACAEAGVLLCYNGQVYDLSKREDRRATAMDALQAEDEAEGIRDRNLRTARLNAEAGRPHGPVLYGYQRRYDADTGNLVAQVPHPEHAPIVSEIFERTAAGESGYAIYHDLNRRNVPPPARGELWCAYHISDMLRNPSYVGRRVWQGRDIGEATWPGIVVPDTWSAVQRILRAPERTSTRNRELAHLLSGIATCGVCADAGVRSRLRVQKNRGYLSYMCRPDPAENGVARGFCVAMREDKFDAYVEEALLAWLSTPAAAQAFAPVGSSGPEASARLVVERLEAQLAEARGAATRFGVDGTPELSVASLTAIEAALGPKIREAQRRAEPVGVPPVVRRLAGSADAEVVWSRLLLPQRRLVIRTVVRVRLNRARVRGVRSIEPGRITLVFAGEPGFGQPG